MIGATMTMPNSRGSRRSSISSFQIEESRRVACQLHCRRSRTDASVSTTHGEDASATRSVQNDAEPDALQHDAAQRDQEVAGRHDVGDRPAGTRGMLAIGKMKPDSISVGRNDASSAS